MEGEGLPPAKKRKISPEVQVNQQQEISAPSISFSYAGRVQNDCPVMISGGAAGADTVWAKNAQSRGHLVLHMVAENHRIANIPGIAVRLTEGDLKLSNDPVYAASKSLGRWFKPTNNDYISNLLRRNYHQITLCKSVYAVGTFLGSIDMVSQSVNLKGGTAWACQMFVERLATEKHTGPIPLYFFDQAQTLKWYQCTKVTSEDTHPIMYKWEPIETPPAPGGVYAAIGARELDLSGINAIGRMFK